MSETESVEDNSKVESIVMAITELPLVTVNILSFNRKEELRHTLNKVYEQDYKNIEVIVVDNASSDGSAIMVEEEFPNVILIKLEKNIGIAGWNRGFEIAKGEFVLVLDDDSYPDEGIIDSGVKEMHSDNIGVIAYDIFNLFTNQFETENYLQFPPTFIGCGALIRTSVLRIIGVYNSDFFLYNNELDFSVRVINKNYKIKLLKGRIVFHQFIKNDSRNMDPFRSRFRYYSFFISNSTFIIQSMKGRLRFYFLFKWIVNRILISVIYSFWPECYRGVLNVIRNYTANSRKYNEVPNGVRSHFIQSFAWFDRSFFRNL